MPTDRLTSTDCDVTARLEKFDPYRNRLLTWTVFWSPWIVLLAVFTRWLVRIPEIAQHHVGVDLLRTLAGEFTEMEPSAWLAVAIAILLLGHLVHRVPATLRMLYLSGVVGLPDREVLKAERDTPPCPPGKGPTPEEKQELDCLFARYVASFQDRLNWVPGSWGFGLAFVLLEFVVIYGAWVNGNKALFQATNPFWAARGVFDWISFRTFFEYLSNLMPLPMLQTVLFGLVLPLIAGLLLGFLAWRMLVVGIRIGSFGRTFGLTILVGHPDRSGGLNPLGDLAALSGVILAVPAIYLSLWLIYTSTMYNDYFVFMLVIVVVLALLAFLGPLYVLHVDMVRYGEPVRRCLDAVRVEMERACKKLQNQIAATPPETPAPSSPDAAEVSRTTTTDVPRAASTPPSATPSPKPNDVDSGIRKAWMEQIASLQKFSETCTVPEWPFDRQVALKFVVPQILPWLTVLFQLTDNWQSILGPILGFP